MAAVNCVKETKLKTKYEINGFPSGIHFFNSVLFLFSFPKSIEFEKVYCLFVLLKVFVLYQCLYYWKTWHYRFLFKLCFDRESPCLFLKCLRQQVIFKGFVACDAMATHFMLLKITGSETRNGLLIFRHYNLTCVIIHDNLTCEIIMKRIKVYCSIFVGQ